MGPDVRELVLSIVISVATGLVAAGIARLVREGRSGNAALIGIGAGLIAGVLFLVVVTRTALTAVPDLNGKSNDEAEALLSRTRLVPHSRPEYAHGVPPGIVVPHSQSLLPGTRVTPGTVVTFRVSTAPPEILADSLCARPTIFSPKSAGKVTCRSSGDGIYRFDVSGTIDDDSCNATVLLWVQPVEPPSGEPGWYLQRPTALAGTVWTGVAQLGNLEYPPRSGHVINVAASVVPRGYAQRLRASGRGPAIREHVPGNVAVATRVVVEVVE